MAVAACDSSSVWQLRLSATGLGEASGHSYVHCVQITSCQSARAAWMLGPKRSDLYNGWCLDLARTL